MTTSETRRHYRDEEDAWTRAIELALTPVVAAGIGWLADRAIGTMPLFTIVLFVFAVAGTFARMYVEYDAKMKAAEAETSWGRARAVREAADQAGPGLRS